MNLRNLAIYFALFFPLPFIEASGHIAIYAYFIFLLYFGLNLESWKKTLEEFPFFLLLFSFSLFLIYIIASAILILSLYFKYAALFLIIPLWLFFKLLAVFKTFRKEGIRAFFLFRNSDQIAWKVLAVIAIISLLERYLDVFAFVFLPFIAEFIFK